MEMWPTDAVSGRSIHSANYGQRHKHLLHRPVSVSPQAMVVVQDTDIPNNVSALDRSAVVASTSLLNGWVCTGFVIEAST